MIVLNPDATAHEAARALENNHVGAVVILDQGRVTGMLTDRDLALRVVGAGLDPTMTEVSEVMSSDVATVASDGTVEQAIEIMRARHVRRVPVVKGEHVVGLVTLDDVMLSGDAEPSTLAEIVRGQLAEPARRKPARVTHPVRTPRAARSVEREERHQSRAGRTLHDFSKLLREELGLDDSERALIAFEVVAAALMQRLTPNEAHDFVSQLPSIMRERLDGLPVGPDPQVTRASLEADMAMRLDLDREAATQLVRRVAVSLSDFVSEPEIEQVIGQLPRDMKQMFAPAP